jgi:hypothetical protein
MLRNPGVADVAGATVWTTLTAVALAATVVAQTPQPFPRPGGSPTADRAPAPQAPAPQAPATARPPAQTAPPAPPPAAAPGAPTAATLGFPIYPTAQFLASYDAGRSQRYHIFGTTASFLDTVAFYRAQLGERGDEVFKLPPTHVFEIGRFREETMAFPPGVTVKDWTTGSQGYPNPKPGGQPARFPTIIMIVPAPPAAAAPQR